MSTSLEVRKAPPPLLERLDEVIQWVIDAPVEEVCWRMAEIGTAREWALAQKRATELRQKAVRLELIALRRVALSGLEAKIPGVAQVRKAAMWLATLSDDEFSVVLAELDGDRSPIALYRENREQREALEKALREKSTEPDLRRYPEPSSDEEEEDDRAYWRQRALMEATLKPRTASLLEAILRVGESFTVDEAAMALARALGIDYREESAEGLREVIRTQIRHAPQVSITANVSVPSVFTVYTDDGDYIRVPISTARVADLVAHERAVSEHAEAAMARSRLLKEAVYSIRHAAMRLRFPRDEDFSLVFEDLAEPDQAAILSTRIRDCSSSEGVTREFRARLNQRVRESEREDRR